MGIISFHHTGDFKKTEKYFKDLKDAMYLKILEKYGERGVRALASATPVDSGKTAKSWRYEIEKEEGKTSIVFLNSNVNNGVNIAIILQYGHGTNHGGYVQGRDYINPAMRPVFDQIIKDIWEEVLNL